MTKHHRLGASNNRHLFLIVPKARTCKIKVCPQISVFGESSLLGLEKAAFRRVLTRPLLSAWGDGGWGQP